MFFCAYRTTSFLALDLVQLLSSNGLELLPFFSHCGFFVQNLLCFLQENEFVHHIVMVHRILLCRCDVVFVTSLKSWFRSLSCGFMRLHNTSVLCRRNFVGCSKPCYGFLKAKSGVDFSSCAAWPLRHAPPTSYLHS